MQTDGTSVKPQPDPENNTESTAATLADVHEGQMSLRAFGDRHRGPMHVFKNKLMLSKKLLSMPVCWLQTE